MRGGLGIPTRPRSVERPILLHLMNNVFYIIGVVVVILVILKFIGLY